MTEAVVATVAPPAARAIPNTRARSRPAWRATWAAFRGMVRRDLVVLVGNLPRFVLSATVQPTLLLFVFTYVFPQIGQGVGGRVGAARFSTALVPGIVANSIIFVGIFTVGMHMVFEIYADELEDRVLAPAPIATAAMAKIVAGSIQALIAGLLVFPIAVFLPATSVQLEPNWPVLLTMVPLACVTAASLGLLIGAFSPEAGPWLFSLVALPVSFLGAVFYSWSALAPMPVVQHAVLANPLVYMSEGLRAALAGGMPHMPLIAVYPALVGFAVVFTWLGMIGFRRRMLA